jgi:hypothetical protein
VDGSSRLCYHRPTEGMTLGAGGWRVALLVGIIVAAASAATAAEQQEYVIWRSSAVNGFSWEPASRAYASKDACDEAIQSRRRWVGRTLGLLRRIGADDAIQRAVGDRIYECRPALPAPPSEPARGGAPQSP